jgi:hypothetical protein
MAKGWTVEKNTQAADPVAERLAQLDRLIDEQKARLATLPAAAGGMSKDDLREVLAGVKEDRESTRSVRHSNADHLHVSAFSHPLGDLKQPKARLTRETYFNNHRESEDDLTPAEIDAYNAITHTCEARGGSEGGWTAVVKGNRLLVNVPSYTIDERMNLPNGLVLILRELAEGPRAVTPENMATRIAELERLVKSQQAEAAGVLIAAP